MVVDDLSHASDVARRSSERTAHLIAVLRELDVDALVAPSRLPGWNRLTIVCHLRYGAAALLRMTVDTLDGRATSYYPLGRAGQRPATLEPAPGELPYDVVDDWAATAARLDALWSSIGPAGWAATVTEPIDNADLGEIPLARLALARLTEVDVHGVDLDVGFPDWSDLLVEVALPTRLGWLPTCRVNHRDVDGSVQGTWLLVADDFRWIVSVDGGVVTSGPAGSVTDRPRATITGTRRDLLALLLGRPRRTALEIDGDVEFGAGFERAFPGP